VILVTEPLDSTGRAHRSKGNRAPTSLPNHRHGYD
jgi:hypothetical protein